MSHTDQISLFAAIVSVVAMLVTASFLLIESRRERLNQRMQASIMRQEYFATLRTWADQLSDLFSEAVHLSELDPKRCPEGVFFERRNRIRTSFSSLIDRGKWFFSNLHSDSHGQHKEAAYRGYRQKIINSLVAAYNATKQLDYVTTGNNPPHRDRLVKARREFVSEVQAVLDPVNRNREFTAIMKAVTG